MNPDTYLLVRGLHVGCVSLSLALFLLRSAWQWRGSPLARSPWARVLPHVNDTLLLLAGIALAALLGFAPWRDAWLAAKLAGLVAHVLLAVAGTPRWVTGALAAAAWLGSLLAFAYVVAVALRRDPWLGLVT